MIWIHKITDTLRLALHNLNVHKVRSLLTVLGIIFGVCGVIAMLAINEGAAYDAQMYLRELGSDNIIVRSVKSTTDESRASDQVNRVDSYGLTKKDVGRLADMPGVVRCVMVHGTQKNARVEMRLQPIAIIATEPAYMEVVRTCITAGRFLTNLDMILSKPHCVISESLASRLFVCQEPLGSSILLDGIPFIVVGIIDRLPDKLVPRGGEGGNYMIIPSTTDRGRFGEMTYVRSSGSFLAEKVEVTQCILRMADEEAVLAGAEIARDLMLRYHGKQDYEMQVPLEVIEQQKKQRMLWNLVGLFIASISLVVGGIGIMNIMLASVNERTREIGIRRALGAKRRDIIAQFLIETVTLTMLGGMMGLAIGVFILLSVEKFLNIRTIVTIATLVLPFGIAIAVGLASGLYPAMRAAKLDPITALRRE